MLILALFVLGLALVPLTGGRWRGLVDLRLRLRWLVLVAFALQFVVLQGPAALDPVGPVLHVLTYGAAGVFVWANRRVTGLLVIAAGAACNGVTIALNGGTLPASPAALRSAGIEVDGGFVNSGVVHDAVLPWLGDVFAVPSAVPLANVFSVGDVLIVAGAWWLLWATTRRPADAGTDGGDGQASADRTADSGTSIQSGRFRVS